MKVFNPITKKNQDMFDILNPVFSVSCSTPNVVNGYKGAAVYLIVEAKNEEEAMDKAILNQEFTKHLDMDRFSRKCLSTYKPSGLYVIGKVEYFEGDERL